MKSIYTSTKVIELGSCAFRQWRASHSHCRFLHGYRLSAKIWISGELDDKNWVFDFGGFKEIKANLEQVFDHKTVVAIDDPHLDEFKRLATRGILELCVLSDVGVEKFAEYVYKVIQNHINEDENYKNRNCKVVQVEVFEHEKNSAIYREVNTK
jgi:6-pyruvoyltetrahydropterin/6-carboxytetrahydropterin synthase